VFLPVFALEPYYFRKYSGANIPVFSCSLSVRTCILRRSEVLSRRKRALRRSAPLCSYSDSPANKTAGCPFSRP